MATGMSCGLCRCVSGGWARRSAPLGEGRPTWCPATSSHRDSVRKGPDSGIPGSGCGSRPWLHTQGDCLAPNCGLLWAFFSRLEPPSWSLVGETTPPPPPMGSDSQTLTPAPEKQVLGLCAWPRLNMLGSHPLGRSRSGLAAVIHVIHCPRHWRVRSSLLPEAATTPALLELQLGRGQRVLAPVEGVLQPAGRVSPSLSRSR